jgi:hypothetical protein
MSDRDWGPLPIPGDPEHPSPPARPLLRRDAACRYLRGRWGLQRAPATLAKLAVIGGGPMFFKAGRWPLYPQDGLDAYARKVLGRLLSSTSDSGERA